jgi:hypothetical protein
LLLIEASIDGIGSDGIFAAAINANGVGCSSINCHYIMDNNDRIRPCHHWQKTPLPWLPLRHCPSIQLPPPLMTTAIDKDHNCHSCHQLLLLSTKAAIAAVDDKQRPLASGGQVVDCVAAAMAVVNGADGRIVDGGGC